MSKKDYNNTNRQLLKSLKTMKRSCRNNTPGIKRCLAGGFTFAYALGVMSTVFTGCADKVNQNNVSENKVTQEEDMTKESQDENKLLMAEELPQYFHDNAIRALESVKTQLGEDAYLSEIANLGSAENANSQGEYVANIIDDVKDNHGDEAATKVMRACGYQCMNEMILTNAKELYSESANMEEFLQKLSVSLGGANLSLENNKIIAIYDQCFCEIEDRQNKLNRCYCQCSCGWYEKLFSTVLNTSVNVDLIQSIKGNADHCKFEITYE